MIFLQGGQKFEVTSLITVTGLVMIMMMMTTSSSSSSLLMMMTFNC